MRDPYHGKGWAHPVRESWIVRFVAWLRRVMA